MKITVRLENGLLPDKYGKYSSVKIGGSPSVSFPIKIDGVPGNAKSLALIFWIMTRFLFVVLLESIGLPYIPADIKEIPENASQDCAFGMIQGKSSSSGVLKNRYGGPMPPDKTHTYTLTLFALDTDLKLSEGFSMQELNAAMEDHILDKAEVQLPSRS